MRSLTIVQIIVHPDKACCLLSAIPQPGRKVGTGVGFWLIVEVVLFRRLVKKVIESQDWQ
jgi:hypothetical protein